jgi:hypothetical protein
MEGMKIVKVNLLHIFTFETSVESSTFPSLYISLKKIILCHSQFYLKRITTGPRNSQTELSEYIQYQISCIIPSYKVTVSLHIIFFCAFLTDVRNN